MTDASTAALADAAQSRHVVVVGGGVAGLVAALECASVGMHVTVLEERDRVGGVVGSVEVGGVVLDAAVEGFSSRGGRVRALAEQLGLDVVTSAPLAPWIAGLPKGPVPLPPGTLLGVPGNPWDVAVRRVIGWGGTWRAYLDRLRPPLTIGRERSFGRLVRSRMGEKVLQRLVAPMSLGTFGIHPDDVDVEIAASGLSTALTRTGSLAGAVLQLRGDETRQHFLQSVDGGVARLVDALHDRLVELGADVRTGTRVVALEGREDGRWDVGFAAVGSPDPSSIDEASLASAGPAREGVATADAVIVAAPEAEARTLLATHVAALDAEVSRPAVSEVVTLVVDAPALDAVSHGDAAFAVPGTHRATGLVVSSTRWPVLAARLPAGHHVLRVSFGTQLDPPATEGLDEASAVELARAEAETMLGASLRVLDGRRDRWAAAVPASTIGHRDAAQAARAAVSAVPGLAVAGAWIAGSGLAQVVPDAIAEADRVRRALLWGGRRIAE
ncbi:protoporphyrinogen oxidase [Microbacterium sp. RU33B]|uniref:protoporphyrinogen oxidase n=1 Tax=Microbacterium sp. RU33B TaxID=1907390 RepID=UPI00095D84E1|nr:protoporphyrinogen oxidase [Microbacterium sp. RU33B]SIT86523.1 oxygen-dependent protoporphyrinogen oxidase [Microbacterium sp. RU33B]